MYLGLHQIAALSPHAQDEVKDIDLSLVLDHLHHGLNGDQSTSAPHTSTAGE